MDPDEERQTLAAEGAGFARTCQEVVHMVQPVAVRKRSGSNKRRLTATIPIRCTPEQKGEIMSKAAEAGMTVSEFFMSLAVGQAPRVRRRKGVDTKELASLTGQLNYVGNNLNQQVRLAHLGEPVPLRESLDVLHEIRTVVRKVTELLEQRA